MKIKNKIITLKNGQSCLFRAPREDDAKELIELLKQVCGETHFLVNEPNEVNYTVEGEIAFINRFNESYYDVMIVFEIDGKIVGNCSIMPAANKRKERHRCEFGIAILKDYWGLSLGKNAMEFAIEVAKVLGYEQMELDVISSNKRAISLYQSLGFVEVGNIPYAFKYDDGSYDNDLKMMKRI